MVLFYVLVLVILFVVLDLEGMFMVDYFVLELCYDACLLIAVLLIWV